MKATIVTESVPLRQTLTPKETQQLRAALKSGEKAEAVAIVAAAFDYSIRAKTTNTYVLTKKYRLEGDLPDITLQEVVSGLAAFFKDYQYISYNDAEISTSRAALKLKTQLTDEERKSLAKGVIVKDLRESLLPALWSVSNVDRNESFGTIDRAYRRLKQCDKPSTTFHKGTFYGLASPYYEGDFYYTVPRVKIAMGWNLFTDIGGFSPYPKDEANGMWSKGRKTFQPSSADPTTPIKSADTSSKTVCPARTTLQLLVDKLNDRVRGGEQITVGSLSIKSFAVVKGLQSKSVCVFGEGRTNPYIIFKAVGEVYELPIVYADGNATLSLHSSRNLKSLYELPGDLRRLLPAPFRRAVAGQQARGKDSYAIEKSLYIPAMRRLRERVEPKLNDADEQPISVNDFDDEVKGLIAMTTLSDSSVLFALDGLMNSYPEYLTNFPDATITVRFGKEGDPRNVDIITRFTNKETGKTSVIYASTDTPPE